MAIDQLAAFTVSPKQDAVALAAGTGVATITGAEWAESCFPTLGRTIFTCRPQPLAEALAWASSSSRAEMPAFPLATVTTCMFRERPADPLPLPGTTRLKQCLTR
jgi:hypothetical protein